MTALTFSNSDLIAVLAALIAALAMISTVWQTYLARKHNRLSVRPHLDWFREQTPDMRPSIRIVNYGLGPAILQSTFLEFNGKLTEFKGPRLPPDLQLAIDQASFFTRWDMLTPETPFKANHEMVFFECCQADDKIPLDHHAAVQLLNQIGLVIRYRSMYGECFKLICHPDRGT